MKYPGLPWWGGTGDYRLDATAFQTLDPSVPATGDSADVAVLAAEPVLTAA